jgi:hypothetical protein
MFANTQMMGMDLGFPDVCLTPMPVPVPIPYPDVAFGPAGIPAAYNVLFFGTPAHNMATTIVFSLGDTTGIVLGVISHTVMATARHITAAFTMLVGGLPATRMTSVAIQNTFNAPGIRIIPSQPKVLLLKA